MGVEEAEAVYLAACWGAEEAYVATSFGVGEDLSSSADPAADAVDAALSVGEFGGSTGTPLDRQLLILRAQEADVSVSDNDYAKWMSNMKVTPSIISKMSPENQERFREADAAEVEKLEQHETYIWRKRREVPRSSQIFHILAVRTTKADGRPKTRLVINGSQDERQHETLYAPTSRTATVKLLIAMGLAKGHDTEQADVESAFLHASMPEEQQPVFAYPTDEILARHPDKKKYEDILNDHFVDVLKREGFSQSAVDKGLFYHEARDLYINLYVDDALLMGPPEGREWLKELLASQFKMKWLGRPRLYANKIVEAFLPPNSRPVTTPIAPGIHIGTEPLPSDEEWEHSPLRKLPYRQVVGSVLYLATGTRPDLLYPVKELAKWMSRWTQDDYDAALRVLRYVKARPSLGVQFDKGGDPTQLVGYADASFADLADRRSTSGWLWLYMGGIVSAQSRTQPRVSTLMVKAEYKSVSECAKDGDALANTLKTINVSVARPLTLYSDGMGACYVASNKKDSRLLRHVDVRYHHVRELVGDGLLRVVHIAGADNPADILTKPMDRATLEKHLRTLKMVPVQPSSE
ncbi:unnamed protein product [Vitrella brassicaformis CCMP3155]|uniref:Reverse transcriptase Ty1/copia-type domain-containing protein n=1 Tax=Vitrella brassicaformis (strain CCMP3155) TaxID=1169540 RepID=A0A0G4ED01_VITBC|nr:unnamed protein product [Vitrella brassicaformis CCMP3155]|eukprot:CEL93438.1 unnamed protein product [Vitrella brassicaformis CCMP3155]